jgi:UBX domain
MPCKRLPAAVSAVCQTFDIEPVRPRRRQEQEAAHAIAQRTAAIDARRAAAAAALPAETPADAPSGATLLRVRLPHGGTAQRRFAPVDTLAAVYAWVDSLQDFAAWDYVLTSTYPKRELARGDATLESERLVPNAALMVISRDG